MSIMCGSLHLSSSPGLGPTTSFRTNHHVVLRVQTHLHGAVAALKIKSDYHSASGGEKNTVYGVPAKQCRRRILVLHIMRQILALQ